MGKRVEAEDSRRDTEYENGEEGSKLGSGQPKRDLSTIPRRRALLNCTFDKLVETSWEDAWEPDL